MAGQPRQDREQRTEHDRKDSTAKDRIARPRQLGQDIWKRIAGIRKSGQGTTRTGHSRQDREDRINWTE